MFSGWRPASSFEIRTEIAQEFLEAGFDRIFTEIIAGRKLSHRLPGAG